MDFLLVPIARNMNQRKSAKSTIPRSSGLASGFRVQAAEKQSN
jgi:hypothetical protein